MSRSDPDLDRLALGRVVGNARQLAERQGSISDALQEIRGVSGGRNDLLVQGGGLGLGAWLVDPGLPSDLLAAALLISSADHLQLDVLTEWVKAGQQKGLAGARHRA